MQHKKYIDKHGRQYSIDDDGLVRRNYQALVENVGDKYHKFLYFGITDYSMAKKKAEPYDESCRQGERDIHILLYKLMSQGELDVDEVPFCDLEAHVDGTKSIACVNDELKKMILTLPIVKCK